MNSKPPGDTSPEDMVDSTSDTRLRQADAPRGTVSISLILAPGARRPRAPVASKCRAQTRPAHGISISHIRLIQRNPMALTKWRCKNRTASRYIPLGRDTQAHTPLDDFVQAEHKGAGIRPDDLQVRARLPKLHQDRPVPSKFCEIPTSGTGPVDSTP